VSELSVEWIDRGREPQCEPNPAYPNGQDVTFTSGIGWPQSGNTCRTDVPYPAVRCGVYVIECATCGLRVAVTTAGRPDDPRSVTIPCRTLVQ
jgi:hypothetical protein